MNAFEHTLATALRETAGEIAMTTNINDGRAALDEKLDQVDRRRRRARWTAGLVAAAVAAAVVVAVVALRPVETGGPVSPSPSATTSKPPVDYSTSSLTPAVSAKLPYWTSLATAGGSDAGVVTFSQGECAGLAGANPCTLDDDLKLRLESVRFYLPVPATPTILQNPTYAGFLAHLDGLAKAGTAKVSGRSQPTVDGRPATVMTLEVLKDAPGAVGCASAFDAPEDCFPLVAGRAARLALVDQGSSAPPTLIYLSLNGDAPDKADQFAAFDQMLTTIAFG